MSVDSIPQRRNNKRETKSIDIEDAIKNETTDNMSSKDFAKYCGIKVLNDDDDYDFTNATFLQTSLTNTSNANSITINSTFSKFSMSSEKISILDQSFFEPSLQIRFRSQSEPHISHSLKMDASLKEKSLDSSIVVKRRSAATETFNKGRFVVTNVSKSNPQLIHSRFLVSKI
ncbi:hypothetical protein HK099_006102 [Clydaea vesicula]|uniref:Uncharacterized protein n=1 Tax=Clydaea vesicula TaxID=447962 RepID=A0AAD5TZF9_9FUNG|nr:hypothetical protein HK099_006102 [Clydaea vesicula]KAJ3390677.1 hypothetical protein HDU92_000345 [Lobulomyces angularis]